MKMMISIKWKWDWGIGILGFHKIILVLTVLLIAINKFSFKINTLNKIQLIRINLFRLIRFWKKVDYLINNLIVIRAILLNKIKIKVFIRMNKILKVKRNFKIQV
jgi:hypothetical protein